MAEIIDLRNDESIPELEAMLMLLFDKDEVKAIANLRKSLSSKMNRTPKNKEDCYKFIKNELNLLRFIKHRQQKSDIQDNKTILAKIKQLEASLKDCLHKLFSQCIRWFYKDIRVWMTYVRFCQQNRPVGDTGRVLDQMLKVHGSSNPQLFKVAANWELTRCKNVEKARAHLTSGIHLHQDNKELLKDLFKLELADADMKRKACIANDIPIDTSNLHLTSKKAKGIYEVSFKKLKDVEVMNDLMNICEDYPFATDLLKQISDDMLEFGNNERMWDIIATRELKNDEKATPMKSKIGKSVAMYETAVTRLNTPVMWSYYLDALLELQKDTSKLPVFKHKLLMSAFEKADAAQKLPEKYYLIWVEHLQSSDKHKNLKEVLHRAVKQPHLAQSKELWLMLLRAHINRGEEKQAAQVFEQGTAALGKLSLPLWKLMIYHQVLMYKKPKNTNEYLQTKGNNKVEEIFKKSWNAPLEVYCVLAPMYLDWLIDNHGIAAAREMYKTMLDTAPSCKEVHKKMIYLETIQPTMNLRWIRICHQLACTQFGAQSIDVWMDFVKFEISNGDPAKANQIHSNAVKSLEPHLTETFLSEFGLVQTVSLPAGACNWRIPATVHTSTLKKI